MKKQTLIALALTASVAGCATAPPPAPTPEQAAEINRQGVQAAQAFTDCMNAAIPRLDDGTSPADVVARAVLDACQTQAQALSAAVMRKVMPECGGESICIRGLVNAAKQSDRRSALEHVLRARVRKTAVQKSQ